MFPKELFSTIVMMSILLLAGSEARGQYDSSPSQAQSALLQLMQQRVKAKPAHSDSWRSLGRLQKALGNPQEALTSVRRAVDLDPFNAAAHFDLGQLLLVSQPDQAQGHFDRVFAIAPVSSYADQLTQQGISRRPLATSDASTTAMIGIPNSPPTSVVNPTAAVGSLPRLPAGPTVQSVGYEIQSFDGSDDLEQRLKVLEAEVTEPVNRLRFFLETGVLYNSNVTLTPVSRELAQSDSASFQAFASPDLDWKLIQTKTFRIGPQFRGYFTANESEFQAFNLASFQPGMFAERDFKVGLSEAIGRLEYIFSNDFFDGTEVGNRHSATASLTLIQPDLEAYYAYLTIAQSDFSDDGVDPSQSSLDGTTLTGGISRFFQTGWTRVPSHSLGVDFESANTDGDNFRYGSLNLHGSTGWQISDRLKFMPAWGIGYRDYPDFTDPIGRSELFWRVHGRLQYAVNDACSIAIVCGHDRFASDNQDFDTERTEGGLIFTIKR